MVLYKSHQTRKRSNIMYITYYVIPVVNILLGVVVNIENKKGECYHRENIFGQRR